MKQLYLHKFIQVFHNSQNTILLHNRRYQREKTRISLLTFSLDKIIYQH